MNLTFKNPELYPLLNQTSVDGEIQKDLARNTNSEFPFANQIYRKIPKFLAQKL